MINRIIDAIKNKFKHEHIWDYDARKHNPELFDALNRCIEKYQIHQEIKVQILIPIDTKCLKCRRKYFECN